MVAQAVFRVAGLLSRIRTPQRTYSMTWEDKDAKPEFTYEGRQWVSCSWSTKMMAWSERIDPYHWEHWALHHDVRCAGTRCVVCGGTVCTLTDEDHVG